MRILVGHRGYGCETGCCGHTVVMAEEGQTFDDADYTDRNGIRNFRFEHPFDSDSKLEWAKRLVAEVYGEDHVADLDWENSVVLDYDDPYWNH